MHLMPDAISRRRAAGGGCTGAVDEVRVSYIPCQ